jgi:hypothetical protein
VVAALVVHAHPKRGAHVWGRTPARRPPLPTSAPLAWLAALAMVLTFVIVTLVRPPGPLDDPNPAYQRDGLLLNSPVLPQQVAGLDFGGRAVVLLFVREVPPGDELAEWAAAVPKQAEVRVVLPAPTSDDLPVPAVDDPLNRLARAVHMRAPVDGGRPVGYAVVDAARVVRYATIDPNYLSNSFEVATIVGAVA